MVFFFSNKVLIFRFFLFLDAVFDLLGWFLFLDRFNGLEFLLKMKGKTVMFVGDSLGRDQCESLICLISADVPKAQTQMSKS